MENRQEIRSIHTNCLFGSEAQIHAGSAPALSGIGADGSAPDLGSGGRQFESDISDQRIISASIVNTYSLEEMKCLRRENFLKLSGGCSEALGEELLRRTRK